MNIINWFEAHTEWLEVSWETGKCSSDLVDKIILEINSRVFRKAEIRKKGTQFTHTYYWSYHEKQKILFSKSDMQSCITHVRTISYFMCRRATGLSELYWWRTL